MNQKKVPKTIRMTWRSILGFIVALGAVCATIFGVIDTAQATTSPLTLTLTESNCVVNGQLGGFLSNVTYVGQSTAPSGTTNPVSFSSADGSANFNVNESTTWSVTVTGSDGSHASQTVSVPSNCGPAPGPSTTTTTPTGKKVHKSYVCKYVGTPGVDERLQTGQNPIWVDNHALLGTNGDTYVGEQFKDAQGKSVVIVANTAKLTPEPSVAQCPPAQGPPPTTTPPVTTSTTTQPSETTTTEPTETTSTTTQPSETTTTTPPVTTTPPPVTHTTTPPPVTSTTKTVVVHSPAPKVNGPKSITDYVASPSNSQRNQLLVGGVALLLLGLGAYKIRARRGYANKH